MELSEKEREILKLLERDARLSAEEIATMLALEKQYVEEKIKEFEKEGIIIGYRTLIDWERVDKEVVLAVIDVKVTPERDYGFDQVAKKISNFPEVHSVYLMSGTYDLTVVVIGKSMKEIGNFVTEKLAPIEQVQSTVTHFVLKKYKIDGKLIPEREDKRLKISF